MTQKPFSCLNIDTVSTVKVAMNTLLPGGISYTLYRDVGMGGGLNFSPLLEKLRRVSPLLGRTCNAVEIE